MSFYRTAIAAAALGSLTLEAEAGEFKCSIGQYADYLNGIALGYQTDPSDTSTDCFGATTAWTLKIAEVDNAIKTFSTSNYLEPIYDLQEMFVSFTTVFSDCQTTNIAKQLMVRTTKWSGVFDIIGTFGAAYLRQDQDPGTSTLYNSLQATINPPSGSTCLEQSKQFGTFMSSLLNVNTPEAVYYDMLASDLS